MLSGVRFIIIIGLFLRVLVSIWNGFFELSPGQAADPGSFHDHAVYFAQNPTIRNCEENIRHVYSCGLGAIYFLTTDARFVGSLLSNFAWLVSALILLKITNIFLVDKSNQKKMMLIYALLPSSIVFTSITLREPYQLLFVNLGIYAALKIYWNKSLMHWLTLSLSVYFMSFLHGGLLVFGLYIIFSTLILLARRGYANGFNLVKLAFVVPLLYLVVAVGMPMVIDYKVNYGDLENGLAAGIESYQAGGIRAGSTAAASYRDTVDMKSNSDLFLFVPTSLFQYLFEPMPWRINRVIDIVLFWENLLRACLIWKAWAGLRKASGKSRSAFSYIFISYLALETIWSVGTLNWGTAARHHIPSIGLLVLAAFAYSKPLPIRGNLLSPVNVGMQSK